MSVDIPAISGRGADSFAALTPLGPLSKTIDSLRTLIANVPFFLTWTGEATATLALNRIFIGEVGFPIKSATILANTLQLFTREPHGIQAGDVITIEGSAAGAQSGKPIAGVQTVVEVSDTSIQIATALADETIEYPEQSFIIPCARPIIVIAEDRDALRGNVIGTGGCGVASGSLDVLMEADVSPAHSQNGRNALIEARNAYGQLIQGLIETQGTADYMVLRRIDPVSGPEFTAPPEHDDNTARFERWRAIVKVSWGLES